VYFLGSVCVKSVRISSCRAELQYSFFRSYGISRNVRVASEYIHSVNYTLYVYIAWYYRYCVVRAACEVHYHVRDVDSVKNSIYILNVYIGLINELLKYYITI